MVSTHEIYLYITVLSWQSLVTHEMWVSSLWMYYGKVKILWKLKQMNYHLGSCIKTYGVGRITGIHLICVNIISKKLGTYVYNLGVGGILQVLFISFLFLITSSSNFTKKLYRRRSILEAILCFEVRHL
jgi:hypothetical protein